MWTKKQVDEAFRILQEMYGRVGGETPTGYKIEGACRVLNMVRELKPAKAVPPRLNKKVRA